ncbi:glycosyltransferase family 4 protein [Natronolimnohabitans sp. A-GB9]|uniref:glycosyltransferase family 4 protein n=1 Tax=Natronolimnohabitans sp. A-GB9 TaxID=3069757 RepID=UPI0027B75069|nr:glycosyltransferase family 4 protein [Natronolimnohabitans sp. A-GB9]MDQ2052606.1 glycosyltransferase family 4 protein [Natronolimnohabitans sp. A-GB9]
MGGIGLHAHHLSRLQAEDGHNITVYTSDNGDSSLPRRETRDGYEVKRYRQIARPMNNSITPGIVPDLVQEAKDYDVVHIHSHLYFSSLVAAIASTLRRKPIVLTNHGLISQSVPKWLQLTYLPTVGRVAFEAADRILCYHERDRNELLDRGIRTDIEVIHNGIDCEQFAPQATDGGVSSPYIVFVGRLQPGKGAHYLIDAFSRIAGSHPDQRLVIVGDGPRRDELEQLARKKGVAERVEFMGEVPNDELPAIVGDADVFALPSLAEGLPRTVLEALACETPVIATDLEQLRPLVDGVGRLIPPESPPELADALDELLEMDPERRIEMGMEGRERILDDYSWRDTVEQTTAVYTDILEQPS